MPHLHNDMEWNPHIFMTLGIWLTNDLKDCECIDVHERWAEIKKLYTIWLKRQMTPLDNAVLIVKIVHLRMLLPVPPHSLAEELQNSVLLFVWDKKGD